MKKDESIAAQLAAIGYKKILDEDTDWYMQIAGGYTLYAMPLLGERVCVCVEPSKKKIEVQGFCAFNCTFKAIDTLLASAELGESAKKHVGDALKKIAEANAEFLKQA